MKKLTCTLYGGRSQPYENVHVGFLAFMTSRKRKTSTASSYNLILYHFHTKSMWTYFSEGGTKVYINGPGHMTKMAAMPIYVKNFCQIEQKVARINGHGGVIIQLRSAIFERIRNAQIKAVQTVSISLLSAVFSCVFHI